MTTVLKNCSGTRRRPARIESVQQSSRNPLPDSLRSSGGMRKIVACSQSSYADAFLYLHVFGTVSKTYNPIYHF